VISVDTFKETTEADHLFLMLSPAQEQAVFLLASGHNQGYVAQQVGVNRRTLYTWLNDNEEFRGVLNSVRKEFYTNNLERLAAVGNLALERLTELIQSKEERISLEAVKVALQAAQMVYG
jgi:hypothetical protein